MWTTFWFYPNHILYIYNICVLSANFLFYFLALSHLQETSCSGLDLPPWKCSQCDRRFSFRSSMIRHTRIVHQGERNFKCVCGRTSSTQSNLKRHRNGCEVYRSAVFYKPPVAEIENNFGIQNHHAIQSSLVDILRDEKEKCWFISKYHEAFVVFFGLCYFYFSF